MRDNQLWWFGHIQRRPINAAFRKSDTIHIEDNARGQGKQIKLGRDDNERLGMVRFDRYYGA